jgi:hypothetical protein
VLLVVLRRFGACMHCNSTEWRDGCEWIVRKAWQYWCFQQSLTLTLNLCNRTDHGKYGSHRFRSFVMCLLSSCFNQNLKVSTDFKRTSHYRFSWKFVQQFCNRYMHTHRSMNRAVLLCAPQGFRCFEKPLFSSLFPQALVDDFLWSSRNCPPSTSW